MPQCLLCMNVGLCVHAYREVQRLHFMLSLLVVSGCSFFMCLLRPALKTYFFPHSLQMWLILTF